MTVSPGQPDALRPLRERMREEGPLFWLADDQLAVLDPAAAQALNAQNFSDLTLPDKLSDLLLRREGRKIPWQQVRELWLAQVRRLSEPERLERLAGRMEALLLARAGAECDLVELAQEAISQALLPVVIDGLRPAAAAAVLRDQQFKIRLVQGRDPGGFRGTARGFWIQLRAGWAVRRELLGRAAGKRPRQLDLTDPIADFLPELGIGRAVDAVTGVLTAIGGPPGGAAACLVYALVRHPDWHQRLKAELAAVPLSELCSAPARAAPAAHRFVRETLRLWSPTAIVGRKVRKEIEFQGTCLRPGQDYLLSPDLLHHDPRYWKDPDTFDPDRWLPEAERGPRSGASYVPFGWAPRACIGAGLGMAQLILFCHLLCVRFRLEAAAPDQVAMALPGMPIPQNLRGTVAC